MARRKRKGTQNRRDRAGNAISNVISVTCAPPKRMPFLAEMFSTFGAFPAKLAWTRNYSAWEASILGSDLQERRCRTIDCEARTVLTVSNYGT